MLLRNHFPAQYIPQTLYLGQAFGNALVYFCYKMFYS